MIDQTEKVKQGLLQELLTKGMGHTEFKMTEIGEIPVEWEVVPIGKLFKQVHRPISMDDDTSYQLVTVKRRQGGIVSRGKLKGNKIKVKSQFKIKLGDFLISKRQIVHGACEVVPNDFNDAIVSNEYSILSTNQNLNIDYFRWLSRTPFMMNYFLISSIGVHIEKMLFKLDYWFRLKIAVPPIDEQIKIANIFNGIESDFRNNTEQLNSLQNLKKGLMQDLLTGKVRVKI